MQEALAGLTGEIAQRKTNTRANPKPTSTVQNSWTQAGDGELYRATNPERESYLRPQNLAKIETEFQWRPEGTSPGIPFNSSNQRATEDIGQLDPQPGDPGWEIRG